VGWFILSLIAPGPYLVGAVIWLGYVPLYAFGVPVLRSLVWIGSAVGLGMIVWAILAPV
jgi:uncharacterized MAPEG superfamily protein